jgi:glycosyltransferase involved in cell wall biosynthesis
VVQTIQNFRLTCANAMLLRDGGICRECVGRAFPWPALVHRCYHQDRAATAVITLMLGWHRLAHTWRTHVDRFIVPTVESRQLLIEAGLPAERLALKPNFVDPDPGVGDGSGGYALFVGRLSPEKGLATLLDAWSRVKGPFRLKLAGSGPLDEAVQAAAARDPRIEWLGWQPKAAVMALLRAAAFSVAPSIWYEVMPRAVIEAFAAGTPVIASDLGALRVMVQDGVTGLRFPPGEADQLAAHLAWAFANPAELGAMRARARQEYERRYTAERSYALQLEIYHQAIERAERRRATEAPLPTTS